MFNPSVRSDIDRHLAEIQQSHGVRILYACESGSRAWGFASPDSDYDVRFIYLQPREAYFGIRDRRDVIELPVNDLLDINGWDLRKALQLFHKSNGPLYEWLQSPIVYLENGSYIADMRSLMSNYFSLRAGCHHYLSMTRNTFENDLRGPRVRLKKYFYALRPALACQWILTKQEVPPMEFHQLRTLVTDGVWQQTIDDLLEQKKVAGEKEMVQPIALLQEWIADILEVSKPAADAQPSVHHDVNELDQLFRKTLGV